MGNQIVSWLCLTMAIASIACHHSVKGEASADDHMDSGTANDKVTSAGDDVEHHDGGRRSGVEEAVVHERRGAYGGSDLHKKPPNTTSSGATNLPLTNLACCVFVCFLIASFTLG